jgi:DNA-binding IclR family transcriptional regulator
MKNQDNGSQLRLIQSVDRAIHILKCLASEPRGVPLTQLSKKLDLPPQTLNSW